MCRVLLLVTVFAELDGTDLGLGCLGPCRTSQFAGLSGNASPTEPAGDAGATESMRVENHVNPLDLDGFGGIYIYYSYTYNCLDVGIHIYIYIV